jgi:hypothetical protein
MTNSLTSSLTEKRKARYKTGLTIAAVQYCADLFAVNQTLVLRINICCENRHLRKARNH